MVRVDGINRVHNTKSDGYLNADSSFRCIGDECMAWRALEIAYSHGDGPAEHHGYCGLAGKPAAFV